MTDEPLDYDMINEDDTAEEPIENSPIVNTRIDLDAFVKQYTGYAYMKRLLFISDVCPPLRFEALKLLIDYVYAVNFLKLF